MKKYRPSPQASEITIFLGVSVFFLCEKAECLLSDGMISVKFQPNVGQWEHLVMSPKIASLGSLVGRL